MLHCYSNHIGRSFQRAVSAMSCPHAVTSSGHPGTFHNHMPFKNTCELVRANGNFQVTASTDPTLNSTCVLCTKKSAVCAAKIGTDECFGSPGRGGEHFIIDLYNVYCLDTDIATHLQAFLCHWLLIPSQTQIYLHASASSMRGLLLTEGSSPTMMLCISYCVFHL